MTGTRLRRPSRGAQCGRRCQTVHAWQLQVHEDYIVLVPPGEVDGLFTTAGDLQDMPPLAQDVRRQLLVRQVIFRQQNAEWGGRNQKGVGRSSRFGSQFRRQR